ncbi:molybdenum cofactor biosynthesis protein MoaE [Paenibacillus sp. J5C_2022]|nr:molybdenum cofactor biosynthesis protein MoaE [Paenibacillus sp. J5C2022]MCU6710406.1 molybdenum cofactor biosynthesis protein MoaE [Paenibacillus sp. J5C2022]
MTSHPIHADEVLRKVVAKEHGATLLFIGTTREWTGDKRTVLLEYEAYEPMAIAMMKQIGEELHGKWPGSHCAITHRIGPVGLAETSVAIAVSTPHRNDCYEASRYAIERLKQIVPVWKKEVWADGSEWKGYQGERWNPASPVQLSERSRTGDS